MIDSRHLTRASGLATIAAALLYVPLLLFDGWRGSTDIGSGSWWIVYNAATLHHFFLLFGLMGLFAAQLRQAGTLLVVAFVAASLGNALVGGVGIVQLTMLPPLAANADASAALACTPFYPPATEAAAGFVERACAPWDFAVLTGWVAASWLIFMLGSIVLGIAVARVGVLPRSAGVLLSLGWLVQLAGLMIPLPTLAANAGYLAIVAALAWLGLALWRERR